MSSRRPVSGREVIAALERVSFVQVGQRGSHVKLRSDGGRVVIVPTHRELARGTLGSILRQAGFDRSKLDALLE